MNALPESKLNPHILHSFEFIFSQKKKVSHSSLLLVLALVYFRIFKVHFVEETEKVTVRRMRVYICNKKV